MAVIQRFKDLYRDLGSLDPEKLHQVYADDIVFTDPITTHQGIQSVKRYFARLTSQAQSCKFDIDNTIACNNNDDDIDYVVTWTMTLKMPQRSSPITLDGITQLRICNDRISYHRDYYDLGEMVYEHLPVLGWFTRKVKKRLAT